VVRSRDARIYHEWYNTRAWRATRDRQLSFHPLCVKCLAECNLVHATVCDHVEPHRGDPIKFWHGPFQSLCDKHHNRIKQREDNCGYQIGVTTNGRPLDMNHPWNKNKR
jgi:5-methylcytosine-specific restriction protein A